MALVFLTKDPILGDYILADFRATLRVTADASTITAADIALVDADTCPPPYPFAVCLLIARQPLETDLPVLLRPLAPGVLDRALHFQKEPYRLLPERRAILSKKGSLSLPPLEYALLETLFESRGDILSRERLCACLLAADATCKNVNESLTVYMYRLRKKLRPLGMTLSSHHKRGYSLEMEDKTPC